MKNRHDGDQEKPVKQRYYVTKEIQFTIALLVVLALLGGMFLQNVSSALVSYLGMETPALGVIFILGYILIIAVLAIVFSHRLVGPFKRIEMEMRIIRSGNISRRLIVRTRDDLHVRNFVGEVNVFIADFEKMSTDYSDLNSAANTTLSDVLKELSTEEFNREEAAEKLKVLQQHFHEIREKW